MTNETKPIWSNDSTIFDGVPIPEIITTAIYGEPSALEEQRMMSVCIKALAKLEPRQRKRVLNYLSDFYDEIEPK